MNNEERSNFRSPQASGLTVFWLLVCFTFSGMCGLIYEVAWVRQLELVFGTTTFAVATVLAAFMGGLACGSYSMGRLASRFERFHPLRVYGVIEVLIAVAGLTIPLVFHALVPLYQFVWKTWHSSFVAFSLLRFLLSAVVLLVPTVLMGATLPLLSGFVSRNRALGERRIGWLYTFNTLGAVLGAAAAGLLLFPTIGLAKTQWVAIAMNLAVAVGSFLLAAWQPDRAAAAAPTLVELNRNDGPGPEDAEAGSRRSREAGLLVAIYAFSGLVAMVYEVAWSRALVLALGCSTYAYTVMLTTFLLGLALGAGLGTRLQTASPLLAAGFCQAGIALSTYLGVYLLNELPFVYLRCFDWLNPSARQLLHIQFLLSAAVMALPTLCLGAMFPIALRGLKPAGRGAARLVGWAYALNTCGAIAGSLSAGFWLVPRLGSQATLLAGIVLNTLLALAALAGRASGLVIRLRVALSVLLLAFAATVCYTTPGWDQAVLSAGVFRYARDYLGLTRAQFIEKARRYAGQILQFKEGLTCTVTVIRTPENMVMMINSKPDASTPSGFANPLETNAPTELFDLTTQTLAAQIPMMLAPCRDEVLVVGLGSGVTLGSVLTHPIKRVQCLEMEQGVVEGSRFFEAYNHRPLDDPRLELIVNDARNHLLVTERKYDVIISEPSNPWIPGAAKLFTREFFETCRAKLNPEGVFCQWIQLYELQDHHFETILRTFLSVFPEGHLFRVKHDSILVGSLQPRKLSIPAWQERLTPAIRRDLEEIHIRRVEDFLAYYWIGADEARRHLKPGRHNTDDNMLIEFEAPLQILSVAARGLVSDQALKRRYDQVSTGLLPSIELGRAFPPADFWAAVSESALKLPAPVEARRYAAHSLQLQESPRAAAVLIEALDALGQSDQAAKELARLEPGLSSAPEFLRSGARFFLSQRNWPEARRWAERARTQSPCDPLGQYCLGAALYHLHDLTNSLACLGPLEKLAARSEWPDLPFYIGSIHWRQGRHDQAITSLRTFLQSKPDHLEARTLLADALLHAGSPGEAAIHWRGIAQINAARAQQLLRAAEQDWRGRQEAAALLKIEEALRLQPTDVETVLLLARCRAASGGIERAIRLLEDYLSWNRDRPLAIGYLGQLYKQLGRPEQARAWSDLYHAKYGTPWVDIDDAR